MHPFIMQSIAAERARDLRQSAGHNRDVRLARGRRQRQHRTARTPGTARLLPAWLHLQMS
jgi:hypothetical protein